MTCPAGGWLSLLTTAAEEVDRRSVWTGPDGFAVDLRPQVVSTPGEVKVYV